MVAACSKIFRKSLKFGRMRYRTYAIRPYNVLFIIQHSENGTVLSPSWPSRTGWRVAGSGGSRRRRWCSGRAISGGRSPT